MIAPISLDEIIKLTNVNITAHDMFSNKNPNTVHQRMDAGIFDNTFTERIAMQGIKKAIVIMTLAIILTKSFDKNMVVFFLPTIILLRIVPSAYSLPTVKDIKTASITNKGTTNISSKQPSKAVMP